ncbi:MAG: DUF1501 domain-containing protein [Acidobacteria bacterium]|nr:DUF1501 domain-containing protein [Acidobacteriota bacterium]
MSRTLFHCNCSRRELFRKGLGGLGVSAGLPVMLSRASEALAAEPRRSERILVVLELSGGNDGLNTVAPYRDDEYYRVRPTLAIPKDKAIAVTDEAGFHPSLIGFERLYKDGLMAVVEGCGYPNPSLSHFSSMSYWHTGVPHSGEALGWAGRFADAYEGETASNAIINIGSSQSLAVRSGKHSPLVFDDPAQLRRAGSDAERAVLGRYAADRETPNANLAFLRSTARNAAEGGALVRDAWASYKTPVDYGLAVGVATDLRKVAALIAADLPTQIYYVSYRGNAFDTHVHQADLHERLLMYTADAVNAFMKDLERIGRRKDVGMMIFTEFGRRVEENASQGTDHGTAGPMFLVGEGVQGGFYGRTPSLTDLDDGNLKMTTDFRRVYATMIAEWMQYPDTAAVLKGRFEPLNVFA